MQGIFSLALGKKSTQICMNMKVMNVVVAVAYNRDLLGMWNLIGRCQYSSCNRGMDSFSLRFLYSASCPNMLHIHLLYIYNIYNIFLWHPIILSENDWCVQSPPKRIAFGFHEIILRR